MSNKLKKDQPIYQMDLLTFYLIMPKELREDFFPKGFDLSDPEYVVRFYPDLSYIEVGYEGDRWTKNGRILKIDSQLHCGTQEDFDREAGRPGAVAIPIEF